MSVPLFPMVLRRCLPERLSRPRARDDTLKAIAHELVAVVRSNATVDWDKKSRSERHSAGTSAACSRSTSTRQTSKSPRWRSLCSRPSYRTRGVSRPSPHQPDMHNLAKLGALAPDMEHPQLPAAADLRPDVASARVVHAVIVANPRSHRYFA